MILTIILFSVTFIIITLSLLYLACIVSPFVSKQTKIMENYMFSQIEHRFSKLEDQENNPDSAGNKLKETDKSAETGNIKNKKLFKIWKQCYKLFFTR